MVLGRSLALSAMTLWSGYLFAFPAQFYGDMYTVNLIGVDYFDPRLGSTQGVVFNDGASPGGTFLTNPEASPTGGFSSHTFDVLDDLHDYRTQVDAPVDGEYNNEGRGTTLMMTIHEDGILEFLAGGNMSYLLPEAVTVDIVFSGLEPLDGIIASVNPLTFQGLDPWHMDRPSIVDVTADGFTLRLHDDFGLDGEAFATFQIEAEAVPAPPTMLLLAAGMLGLRRCTRRRRS